EALRLVDGALKDHFDHWLAADPNGARQLIDCIIEGAEDRQRKRQQKELERKSATRKLRLPGKLADCSRGGARGTEIFLVERDDAHKEALLKTVFKAAKGKVELSRFKGLGEMPSKQLRDTTMDPKQRTLLRVTLPDQKDRADYKKTVSLVESLMGRKPELRFEFIQKNAKFVRDLDV